MCCKVVLLYVNQFPFDYDSHWSVSLAYKPSTFGNKTEEEMNSLD
uniref:Uncharacterized protein n=1 Tax=Anguilla anguilla TaxID=7936 RepID=A0A0E9R4L9_ANGAN